VGEQDLQYFNLMIESKLPDKSNSNQNKLPSDVVAPLSAYTKRNNRLMGGAG